MVTVPDIPGHKVGGVIGTGGFATVYRSWQIAVGREVAVKVDNRVLASERDQRRFVREVTAAGRLSGHPHVIDVYDARPAGRRRSRRGTGVYGDPAQWPGQRPGGAAAQRARPAGCAHRGARRAWLRAARAACPR